MVQNESTGTLTTEYNHERDHRTKSPTSQNHTFKIGKSYLIYFKTMYNVSNVVTSLLTN